MPGIIRAEDLSAEQLKDLGLEPVEASAGRRHEFTIEHVRRHAIRVMAVLDKLSSKERRRVLEHALKLNKV
jgi:hypothetical protein